MSKFIDFFIITEPVKQTKSPTKKVRRKSTYKCGYAKAKELKELGYPLWVCKLVDNLCRWKKKSKFLHFISFKVVSLFIILILFIICICLYQRIQLLEDIIRQLGF